ncbi:MAG: hypothetical protein ACPGQL_04145 [Thermoplasmatota archaeon]
MRPATLLAVVCIAGFLAVGLTPAAAQDCGFTEPGCPNPEYPCTPVVRTPQEVICCYEENVLGRCYIP